MSDNWRSTIGMQQTSGQMLKSARESMQLSINDVAQTLLLSRAIVGAIEEDDYSNISAQVYAEGYLKAYARLVQIPVNTVITAFRRLNVYSTMEPKIKIEPKRVQRTQLSRLKMFLNVVEENKFKFLGLGILICAVLTILIFFVVKQVANRNAEIISVPNVSDNADRKQDKAAAEERMPLVTNLVSGEENDSKNKKKASNKQNRRGGQKQKNSLMLDGDQSDSDDDEPEIILTKPKRL